jgi:FAD/FMN-containing dehydrogenase/Fe-S oxidoreductase
MKIDPTLVLNPDFARELQKSIRGEYKDDFVTKLLYSTDASIYQIDPLGVVFPHDLDDLSAIVELSGRYHVPIIPRGSGSSLAGQTVGQALIVDISKYLNHIIELNPEEQTATVEPGVILNTLNRQAARYGLTFGPDPASAERASIGGSLGCNATGAHSIVYGMSADHLLETEVILADNEICTFAEEDAAALEAQPGIQKPASRREHLYRTALDIRRNHIDTVKNGWPQVWRRASGYNLNYLLPWTPTRPPQWDQDGLPYPPVRPGKINLSQLIVGSEGTLAVIRKAKLRLVKKPLHTILSVLTFDSIAEACDQTTRLLEKNPTAIELIPGEMLRLARAIPAMAMQLGFVQGDPEAMLVVEFSGPDPARIKQQALELEGGLIAETTAQQNQVWNIRKMGLGILNSLPGDQKPMAFIEDVAVPVEKLGSFVRSMEEIMGQHGIHANFYAHASAGCLHIRPIISTKGARDVAMMKAISTEAIALVLGLNGSISGEHGDGIARSEYIESNYGSDIYQLFKQVKRAADPENLFNPGKKTDPFPMDENLRFGPDYVSKPWEPFFDYSRQGGFAGAIEMCNGQGVCRKDFGLMCPSFQVLQDEKNSPRGRSNLLRALISGKFPMDTFGEQAVMDALDMCLACKGCKSECSSGVDVAKLKFDFLYRYYKTHPHKLRDYLFGYIHLIGPLAGVFSWLVNPLLGAKPVKKINEKLLKLSASRDFPAFAPVAKKTALRRHKSPDKPDVLFFLDSFTRDMHPETAIDAVNVLEKSGLRVLILPVIGAGRALTSKGFLPQAKQHALKLIECIRQVDPQGKLPVVGVEPSETFMLRDEFVDYFPADEYVQKLAKRAWLIDEFLIRPNGNERSPLEKMLLAGANGQKILLHGQCVQKVQPPADDGLPVGPQATMALLKQAGYQVEMIETTCCGMAGSFGYEAEHYDLSMKLGELSLFPAVRAAGADTLVSASGTSCRAQIKAGTGKAPIHPASLIRRLY